jgi:adenylosuccinate synthase
MQDLLPRIGSDHLRELSLFDLGTEAVARDLTATFHSDIVLSSRVPQCETAIFEGAQGVLLDEYRGFHPYTTWSTVTTHHAWELVQEMQAETVTVLGITRAYTTRHGEGPLPTWSGELTARLLDPGNPENRWQGSLRCGWLDLPLLRYAAAVCPVDGIVVNHLDQVAGDCVVCDAYGDIELSPAEAPNLSWQSHLSQQLRQARPVLQAASVDSLIHRVGEIAPVVLRGFGPTHEDRRLTGIRFRRKAG